MATLRSRVNLLALDLGTVRVVQISLGFIGSSGDIEVIMKDETETPILSLELSYRELLAMYEGLRAKFGGIPSGG